MHRINGGAGLIISSKVNETALYSHETLAGSKQIINELVGRIGFDETPRPASGQKLEMKSVLASHQGARKEKIGVTDWSTPRCNTQKAEVICNCKYLNQGRGRLNGEQSPRSQIRRYLGTELGLQSRTQCLTLSQILVLIRDALAFDEQVRFDFPF